MANSSPAVALFILFSVIVFDLNHAAVPATRQRRSFLPNIFGQGSQTTSRTILKGPTGFLSVSLVGGQKNAAGNPCDPSQSNQQSSGRKPGLIDIKIPSLFSRGRQQPVSPPPECPPPDTYTSEDPNVRPNPSLPPVGQPLPTDPAPTPTTTREPVIIPETTTPSTLPPTKHTEPPTPEIPSTGAPLPASSGGSDGGQSATTEDLQDLIDSIFNEQGQSKPKTENNGAGKIDLRWNGDKKKN